MRRWVGVSALAFGACATALAGGAQAESRHHRHKAARDAREARIETLEGEVQQLVTEVRALRANQQQVQAQAVAAPIAPVAGGAYAASGAETSQGSGQGAGAVVVGGGSPGAAQPAPSGSPSTPTPTTTPPPGGASILAGRPSISSPDGRFTANLHGVMQFDAADYLQDAAKNPATDLRRGAASTDTAHARDLNDGTDFRRARIGIDGKAYGDFEYDILFDFGGSGAEDAGHVQELWLQYSGLKPFHLRIGAFTPSFGLEDQNSTNGMPFLERPASVDLARSVSASDYREGGELWAATDRWYAALAVTSRLVGTINTTGSSTAQTFDQGLGVVYRAAIIPFRGEDWLTHIGVHGSYAFQIADVGGPDVAAGTARYPVTLQERPELRVDGTRLVSTGAIDSSNVNIVAAEAAAQWGPVYLQSEYHYLQIDRRNSPLSNPDFSGWYVEGSWIVTGERRRYNTSTFAFDSPPIDHPFDFKQGAWGAWELALRYSDLDLNYHQGQFGKPDPADGVRGGDQQIFTAGVNWYLNPIIRFMLDYQHVDIDRLSPSATTFATPVGAQVGQKYDTISIRSQLAF